MTNIAYQPLPQQLPHTDGDDDDDDDNVHFQSAAAHRSTGTNPASSANTTSHIISGLSRASNIIITASTSGKNDSNAAFHHHQNLHNLHHHHHQPNQQLNHQHQQQQQRKQAFTFTLMIMTVAFATLLTIIRLTLSPNELSAMKTTFVPPPQLRHRNQAISAAAANRNAAGSPPINARPYPAIHFVNAQRSLVSKTIWPTVVIGRAVQAGGVTTSKKSNYLIDSSNKLANNRRNSSQDESNVVMIGGSAAANSRIVASPPSSSTSSGAILTADQRFEKEYRDDPSDQNDAPSNAATNVPTSAATAALRSHVLPKVARKPKLIFDRHDLDETKRMRIDKREGCGEDSGAYADLLVLVNSAIHNFDARAAIRETWGQFAVERGAYFYFLIGSTDEPRIQARVEAEDARHDDLLQGTFFDSYHNLTLKTIAMMRWVATRCGKIRYVLKVDDDMMLNMQHITDFAEINPNFHRVIIGKLAKRWRPHRETRNKWYVPLEAFNGTFFPNFVTGPAYFFTGDAAAPLYETAVSDRAPLYLEDVYMTGIVAEKAGIKRYNHALMRNVPLRVDECSYPKIMTSHKHRPNEIRALWKLVYSGKKCVPPPPPPPPPSTSSTNTTVKAKIVSAQAGVPVPAAPAAPTVPGSSKVVAVANVKKT